MARSSATMVILSLALLYSLTFALQVTPNSPCASFCIDSGGLDKSDPNSSNTEGDDIICQDGEFVSQSKGQKFQRCLSCLQDSTFQQGSENDQDWFLYNLRYSFNYCIFGYPNATGVGSSPCITSEACGPLDDALKQGILDPAHRKQYDYCDADNGVMLGDSYEKCRSCVRGDRTHIFTSNFLTALEAACRQRPAPGTVVGLNDTVFTKTALETIDPTASKDSDSNSGTALSTPAIVGIAIGGLAAILLAIGCCYMQYRRRKNRKSRDLRVRASYLSFRCQTHLSPQTSHFDTHYYERPVGMSEKHAYTDRSGALSSNPPPGLSAAPWGMRPNSMSSSIRTSPKLTNITTTIPCPPPVHSSPKLVSPDDYTTPTSTTSARSNMPLLYHKPYNPADHAAVASPLASPHVFSPGFGIASPRPADGGPFPPTAHYTPPPTRETNESEVAVWEDQPVAAGTTTRDLIKKKGSWNAGAPVEVRNIQTTFAPPPTKVR